jgi:hypothetical protein
MVSSTNKCLIMVTITQMRAIIDIKVKSYKLLIFLAGPVW